MTLTQLFHLLGEARRLSSHDEFVIIGSLSVLGISEGMEIPDAMAMSQDVDCYTKADPVRVFDLVQALGEGSEYEAQTSFYLDAVSPDLPTLPDGWQARLLKISKGSLTAWFLEPNDAAVSKYVRGEPRDIRWIRAGVEAGIVSLPTVATVSGKPSFWTLKSRRTQRLCMRPMAIGFRPCARRHLPGPNREVPD